MDYEYSASVMIELYENAEAGICLQQLAITFQNHFSQYTVFSVSGVFISSQTDNVSFFMLMFVNEH